MAPIIRRAGGCIAIAGQVDRNDPAAMSALTE
jgi:hypothetical protein